MNTLSPRREKTFMTISFIVAVCLPYLIYGFRYFPILDDYIQYGCYPTYEKLSYVYLSIGTLSIRPLASLLDPAFWGQFWPAMGFALVLVTAMHLTSGFMFRDTLKKYSVTLSPLFFLIYLLFPLGMEGRYWLSASTRIVTGLFFASLSLWFLAKFLEEKTSLRFFTAFAFFQLISCGFYESASVFSVSAAVLLFCISFYKNKKKICWLVPVTSFFNITLMFIYYKIFALLGAHSSRAESISLTTLPAKLFETVHQTIEAFSKLYDATFVGFVQGIKLLFSTGFWGIVIFILITAVCCFISRLVKDDKPVSKQKKLCLFSCGIILFFAPLMPNALTADVWITNRSLFVSFIGFALILEGFWYLFHKKQLKKLIIFFIAFLFITASLNEYDTYRRVSENDQKLLDEIILQMDEAVLSGEKNLQIILPEEVIIPQNAFFKDHIKSIFDSDWALTGALRARTKNLKIHYAEPVIKGTEIVKENTQIIVIENILP